MKVFSLTENTTGYDVPLLMQADSYGCLSYFKEPQALKQDFKCMKVTKAFMQYMERALRVCVLMAFGIAL